MSLKIINLSPDKVDMVEETGGAIFAYKGTIPFNSDSTIEIQLIDEDKNITNLIVAPTCGCTVSKVNKNLNVYTVYLTYDTARRGRFSKQIQVNYRENGIFKRKILTIKGIV